MCKLIIEDNLKPCQPYCSKVDIISRKFWEEYSVLFYDSQGNIISSIKAHEITTHRNNTLAT